MTKQITNLTFTCALSLAFVGCSGSSRPTLIADDEHSIVVGSGKRPAAYNITASSAVRLDISHFRFLDQGAPVTPDTLQVWDNSRLRYRLSQAMAGSVVDLNASTLTNVADGSAFPGFSSGHTYMVNVGRANPPERTSYNMTYDWTGMIIVK